jgi:hypothetical protein
MVRCMRTTNPHYPFDSWPKARRKRTTLSGSYIIHYDCDPNSYYFWRMNHESWWFCTDSRSLPMDTFGINGKRVLEPYVGRSPTPAPPELDHVDIDGTAHHSELPPHAQCPLSTPRPSKSACSHVTASGKAKLRKICGFGPCCGREDVTLSWTYNRPMMVLAVGLVASFRTIFDSFRWNSFRIRQWCYVVSSEAMA